MEVNSRCENNNFSLILVNYKDRLTRFGYKYLKNYLSEFGAKISYLNELGDKSPESEMLEDLVVAIHSFNGKLYGLRSSKNKKKVAVKAKSIRESIK